LHDGTRLIRWRAFVLPITHVKIGPAPQLRLCEKS